MGIVDFLECSVRFPGVEKAEGVPDVGTRLQRAQLDRTKKGSGAASRYSVFCVSRYRPSWISPESSKDHGVEGIELLCRLQRLKSINRPAVFVFNPGAMLQLARNQPGSGENETRHRKSRDRDGQGFRTFRIVSADAKAVCPRERGPALRRWQSRH